MRAGILRRKCGVVTVTAKVTTQGRHGIVHTRIFAWKREPHHPPTVFLLCESPSIKVASIPQSPACSSQNIATDYTYSASGGQVTGNGPQAIWTPMPRNL